METKFNNLILKNCIKGLKTFLESMSMTDANAILWDLITRILETLTKLKVTNWNFPFVYR